eukprot:TRINITY_DN11729_c0_g1_i1.p1 TRINITY_DN11729_c0_g1~~TRINITY_DN11729_c0_g1_i1.p1  ORF type:complete len:334 (+),score=64.31 TRINITY_DN11729_c0_g1_i1:120-1121(+)
MEKTPNYIQSFDRIPALKNALNNLSSQVLSQTNVPTVLISVASKIHQLFAPVRTVNNFSGEKSDEILFADKPNLLESPLQLLLREIRSHFQLAGEPTLSVPSMSLRISAALSCITDLTPLHLLVLHQQSTQEPLLLVVEDEQRAFDERWTALLQQCKVDAPVSVLLDNSVDDVVSNAAVLSTEQQATAEDDEEVDLDIDSPPPSVHEELVTQSSVNVAEIHSEVLVSTTIESHEVSTGNSTKIEEQLVIEAKSTVNQEPVDEELDDVDVADVSESVTNSNGNETHVGQKRNREEEEAIIDGEPEPKRQKVEVETTTTITTVTGTVAVDMIQVE